MPRLSRSLRASTASVARPSLDECAAKRCVGRSTLCQPLKRERDLAGKDGNPKTHHCIALPELVVAGSPGFIVVGSRLWVWPAQESRRTQPGATPVAYEAPGTDRQVSKTRQADSASLQFARRLRSYRPATSQPELQELGHMGGRRVALRLAPELLEPLQRRGVLGSARVPPVGGLSDRVVKVLNLGARRRMRGR